MPRALPALLLILGIGVTVTGPLRGQTPSATRIIDVIATDASGAPLATLQPADLMIRIDGRVHPITDLRVIPQNTPLESGVLPAPYATNQITGGRDIAVAVDVTRLQSSDLPQVKDSINAVMGAIGPRDRISVIALAEDGFATDYTSRPEIVRAIAGKVPATAQPMQDTRTIEAAAIASLGLLERRCTVLAVDPGHKTLVFIAPPFGTSSPVRRAIQSVAEATARQRIQLILIEPRGDASPTGGLAALAAATGGTLLPFSQDLATRFSARAGRTATRYQVQIALTKEEQDDKVHRVQVASLRKEAQVAAPPQLFIPKGDAAPEPLAALTDMLRQPRAWRDLPLRLAVFPVLDVERDRLRLLVLGEPEEPMTALAWAQFALIAPSGAVVAEWKAEGPDLAARPIMTAVLAPAGPYRLRMAASELAGRRGAVDYEFDVRLTPAGSLNLGPLMFGGISNQAFLPMLQLPAEAEAVMAYAEIYGRPAEGDTLASRFEIAAGVEGPALTVDGTIRTTPDADRRAALGMLDLTALKPGDYIVRAIVTLNGKEIGRVTRTLRKAAR
jgi:VWFA-related protein